MQMAFPNHDLTIRGYNMGVNKFCVSQNQMYAVKSPSKEPTMT